MEINSVNNAQSFTGFKLTNKTRQGAARLIEDITSNFADKTKRIEEFKDFQQRIATELQEEVVKPLKNIKAEVEYDDGKIFVRNADRTKTVEVERGKVSPLHPSECTIVQYLTKGDCEGGCVKVDYGTREAAEKMAQTMTFRGPFSDLLKAREIAKHFDSIDAKKVLSEQARTEYQRGLDTLADNFLSSLD